MCQTGTVAGVNGSLARQVLQQIVETTAGCSWAKVDPSRNKSNWPKDGLPSLKSSSTTLDVFARATAWFVLSRARLSAAQRDAEWTSLLGKVGVPAEWLPQLSLPEAPADASPRHIETQVEVFQASFWGKDPLLRLATLEANAYNAPDPIELLAAAVPRVHTARWATAPAARQRGLQASHPLSLEPLVELAHSFDVPFIEELDFACPVSADRHERLFGLDARMAQHMSDSRNARGGLTMDQRSAIAAVYDYLRDRAHVERSLVGLEHADVILVTGVRNTVYYRLDRALELVASSSANPYVVLTGDQPSYESQPQSFTEAGAMASYLLRDRDGERLDPSRVLLEERSRSFRENTFLSLDALQRVRLERGRPLTVVLITAPYALRRLFLIASTQWAGFTHVVQSVLTAHGRTNWNLAALQNDATSTEYFMAGMTRWVNEYLKLFGGRAAGEF